MPISKTGWELHIVRSHEETRGRKKRTIGTYQVYHEGKAVRALSGMSCESKGPGANSPARNGKRIEAKRYPLSVHGNARTRYATTGYSTSLTSPKQMPGIGVSKTGDRTAILIHPGHLPNLFLSSVGCINLTQPLNGPNADMRYKDSRDRVIAVIDDLKAFAGSAFPSENGERIPKAWLVIDGEPE